MSADVVEQPLDRRGVVMEGEALKRADADMRCDRRTSTLERVGEGSSPRISASPVSIRLKVLEVSTPSASSISRRQNLAHAALERQPPVAAPRPGRLAAALGAEIEQSAVLGVAQLREQEAAPVAEVRVVHAELVAVIAQRQRLREPARERRETPEMLDPFRIAQRVQADPRRPALIAVAESMFGETGGFDAVEEGLAQTLV